MSKDIINVGLVGTKFMGKAHANAWSRVPQFFDLPAKPILHTTCGLELAGAQQLSEKFGWLHQSTDFNELIQSDEIDLIDICTSNDSHQPIAVAAAKAGKNILCEKPMARNSDESKEMYYAARENNIIDMMIFNYRFVPAIAQAKKMIEDGRIGQVRHFNAVYYQDWLVDPSFPMVWRHSAEKSGSGAHGDMNAHIIDLARFLVGEFEAVVGDQSVFIKERPISGSKEKGTVTADDATSFMARFKNGAMGNFCATRFANGRKNFLRFELFGSKGSIGFNLERLNELDYYNSESQSDTQGFTNIVVTEAEHPYVKSWWPPGHIIGWEHTFVHEMSHLVHAIATSTSTSPNFYDGLKCQLVLDAVANSHNEARWITIEEFEEE